MQLNNIIIYLTLLCYTSVLNSTPMGKIIFLHGLGGAGSDWEEIQKLIPNSSAVDLLCHNGRPCPENANLDQFVEDLKTQIVSSREKKILVGLSFGGVVALQFAKKYPEEVERLVLINVPASFKNVSCMFSLYIQFRLILANFFSMETIAGRIIPKIFASTDQQFLENAKVKFAKNNKNDYKAASYALLEHDLSHDALLKIAKPTLILCSEKDQVVPTSMCEELKSIPQSQFQIVKDAQHAFPMEWPEKTRDLLVPFLQ